MATTANFGTFAKKAKERNFGKSFILVTDIFKTNKKNYYRINPETSKLEKLKNVDETTDLTDTVSFDVMGVHFRDVLKYTPDFLAETTIDLEDKTAWVESKALTNDLSMYDGISSIAQVKFGTYQYTEESEFHKIGDMGASIVELMFTSDNREIRLKQLAMNMKSAF